MVGFLPAEHEEYYSTVQGIDALEWNGNGTICLTSEVVPYEIFTAQATDSIGSEGKIKVVHKEIRSILDGFYRCHHEGFEVTTLSSSCWRLVPFAVLYFCDKPKGEYMSGVWHEIMVDRPCILCLGSRKQFCITDSGDIQNTERTLSTREEYEMIIDKVTK